MKSSSKDSKQDLYRGAFVVDSRRLVLIYVAFIGGIAMTDTYQEFLMAGMDWYYVRRDTAFINMVAAKGDLARHAEASAEFARICRLGNLFTGDTNDTLHSSVDRETALCNSIDDDEALFRLEASLPSDRRGTSRQEDTWFMRRVRRDLDRLDEILTSHHLPKPGPRP